MKLAGTFSGNIQNVFNDYIQEINQLTIPGKSHCLTNHAFQIKNRVADIQEIATAVSNSVSLYLSNKIAASKAVLMGVLKKYSEDFKELITIPQTKDEISPEAHFYRFRASEEDGRIFSPTEIFHIRRSLRHKCVSYRYSSPGIPGLYLGASSFVGWKEIREIDLSKLQVAKFVLSETASLKFLDFGYSPAFLGRQLEHNLIAPKSPWWSKIMARIVFYPLICACSITTHKDDANFKEEYIIPQFLLEEPKSLFGYDGIRYQSSRIDYDVKNSLINTCFAFTADDLLNTEYSQKLVDSFRISKVYSCSDLLDMASKIKIPPLPMEKNPSILLNGKWVGYDTTDFYKMDYLLGQSEFFKIV